MILPEKYRREFEKFYASLEWNKILKNQNREMNRHYEEAIKHSVSIEGYSGRKLNKEIKKLRKLETQLLKEIRTKDPNIEDIEYLGREISGYGFRTQSVRIIGASWLPPSPEDIRKELVYLTEEISKINDDVPMNDIEKGLIYHFHIVRIHPFIDGNGRVARLILNAYLHKICFPPLVVNKENKGEYIDLLDEAVRGFKYKDVPNRYLTLSEGEKKLYEWMADNILNSIKTDF